MDGWRRGGRITCSGGVAGARNRDHSAGCTRVQPAPATTAAGASYPGLHGMDGSGLRRRAHRGGPGCHRGAARAGVGHGERHLPDAAAELRAAGGGLAGRGDRPGRGAPVHRSQRPPGHGGVGDGQHGGGVRPAPPLRLGGGRPRPPVRYLAARTETMLLGSGVIQVGTRSPVTIAQTAMTLAHLSGGRFLLGLGVSGPQVMEGLHGIPFGHPLGRMRETVEIVRAVFTGEKITYARRHYGLPRPGSKPMRVSLPPVSVPVYLATLSPKMLELTGEIADGWLGTSFVPERADAYLTHPDAGLARAGRTRASLDICQGAEISLVDDADLAATLASRKKELAFSLGGMGSATANFYNDAYSRHGWAEFAARVRERWQAGDRDGAAALVTDEMVLATTLIGTADMVRARRVTGREPGVDTG